MDAVAGAGDFRLGPRPGRCRPTTREPDRGARTPARADRSGVTGLVQCTTTLGYYRMLALNANACTIDLPDELTEPLLPV